MLPSPRFCRSVSAEEQVPVALQAPLAVAQHLLEAPAKAPEPSGERDVEEKESGVAPSDSKDAAAESVSVLPCLVPTRRPSVSDFVRHTHAQREPRWILEKLDVAWRIHLDAGRGGACSASRLPAACGS